MEAQGNIHEWGFLTRTFVTVLESADDQGQKVEWQIEMGGVPSMSWAKDALPR